MAPKHNVSRFIHVDPSLQGVGGHEYDGALNILRAAEAAGFEVALAASRGFRGRIGLPDHWPLYTPFPHKRTADYHELGSDCIALDGSRLQHPSGNAAHRRWDVVSISGLAALWRFDRSRRRRRRIGRFAQACRQLFGELNLRQGDQVYFATISVFELLGLARYLVDAPEPRLADWHLQIHDDPWDGCGSGEEEQRERRSVVRWQLEHVLRHLPKRTLHLYNPTDALVAQYNQLGVATFRHLPHPVSPLFRAFDTRANRPLRVTCAGGVRREKGYRALHSLLATLRDETVFESRLELVTQLPQRKLRRLRLSAAEAIGRQTSVPLIVVPHPLATEAYRKVIRDTDIGLFLYDRKRYRFRCSAVLQEMLAAGKPVIVPAGCWLADQISEPIFRHLEKLQHELPAIRRLQGSDLTWHAEGPDGQTPCEDGDRLRFTDSHSVVAELYAAESATELLVSFRREGSDSPGSYIRLQTEQWDARDNLLKRFDTILGERTSSPDVLTLHRLETPASRLRLRLSNAYAQEALSAGNLKIQFLDSRGAGVFPAGSVGLIAASHRQIPGLLQEMTRHYRHYRDSAQAFSNGWCQAHRPERAIEILTANAVERPTPDSAPSGDPGGGLMEVDRGT